MTALETLRTDILKYAQPLCDEMGLELVELNVRGFNEDIIIQVFIDLPAGGIGIEQCTGFNRRLDKALYEDLTLGENYTLEVSSPGLDRPLRTLQDFRRSVGRDVNLFLRERVGGKIEIEGSVKEVNDAEIILGTGQGELVIAIDKVDRAKQIIS